MIYRRDNINNKQILDEVREKLNVLNKEFFLLKNLNWMKNMHHMFLDEYKSSKGKIYFGRMNLDGHFSKSFMLFSYLVVAIATCLDEGGVTNQEIRENDISDDFIKKVKWFRNYTCHFNSLISKNKNHQKLLKTKNMLELVEEVSVLSKKLNVITMNRYSQLGKELEIIIMKYGDELRSITASDGISEDLLYVIMNLRKSCTYLAIDHDVELNIFASDIDEFNILGAIENAEEAGVDDCITFVKRDFRDVKYKDDYGVIISNPPYGERLSKSENIEKLYQDIGKTFNALDTWSVYILTAFKGFQTAYQKKADRQRKLYNGRIETWYYQYFGPRPPQK